MTKNFSLKPMAAGEGDGSNNVSMINGARHHGERGRAAVRAEDFAFAKFCFLEKILLVHGHWFYNRMATLVHFFFYIINACSGKYLIFISSLHPNLVLYLGGGFRSSVTTPRTYDSVNIM